MTILIEIGVIVAGFFLLWLLARAIVTPIFRKMVFTGDLGSLGNVMIPHEQQFVRNSGGYNIDMWWIPHASSKEALLYLHGNAGRLPHFFESFSREYNVLAPAYPGYGLSEGAASESRVYETAELAYQWLLDKGVGEDQIIIYGHSLGGAPAVYLASRRPGCKKLIVVNSFSSLRSLVRRRYGLFFSLFVKGWFNTAKYAARVKGRVVQFCYRHDKVVPYEECEALFKSFTSTDKDLVTMEGPCHSYFDIEFTAHNFKLPPEMMDKGQG